MGRARLAGWGGTITLSSDKTRHGHTPGDRSRGVCPGPREQWGQLSLCDRQARGNELSLVPNVFTGLLPGSEGACRAA